MDSVLMPVSAPETGTLPAGGPGAGGVGGIGLGASCRLFPGAYVTLPRLAQSGVLGAPRRLAVENYADEGRGFGPEHWLWDPARSGGLTLASDIHWLDLATRLLGPAHEVHTWEHTAGEGLGPRRLVTTAHPCGALASVYHAFDTRPGATGCTVLVAFEEGEARVDGWMPRRLS